MSKTRLIHHIVFGTKRREPVIPSDRKRELYAYLYGILRNHKCEVIRINGVSDHVHILTDIHPNVAIADLVKDLKQMSSLWMKEHEGFGGFKGWAAGYFAATLGEDGVRQCRDYIINQERHHSSTDYLSELRHITSAHGMMWDERDWG